MNTELIGESRQIVLVGYQIWSLADKKQNQTTVAELWAEPPVDINTISRFLNNAIDIEKIEINSTWSAYYDKSQEMGSPVESLVNLNFLPELEKLGIVADFPMWPLPGDVCVLDERYLS
jgi:hypothetical protein